MSFDPNDLPEDTRQEMIAQVQVTSVAWKFLRHFYNGDLAAAWKVMHPTLRLCLSQWWVDANRDAIRGEGLDIEVTAEQLSSQAGPQHKLWQHFERVLLRDFSRAYPLDPDRAGIGSLLRVIEMDTELLYVHPDSPEGRLWAPGESLPVYPLVIGLTNGEWKVLNWASDVVPEPGFPPTLSR
ncbi:hypothetical protein D6T63_07900 [Arthrobacter cheniae]|uniref:Uncharacterized protein n=1 Tax=Arthrobacter cheniae TaxID=1258888 RepID=A0A3A5M9R3_9MICC|nr:hypothetical protein [Arthrobacter cheniae]RJT81085.1 hypothetical protein D6T63_07900 [Arthrobacter cheniae]